MNESVVAEIIQFPLNEVQKKKKVGAIIMAVTLV